MVDTIKLMLHRGQYQIKKPGRFSGDSMEWILNPSFQTGVKRTLTARCNPSKADIKAGIYRPQLTIVRRPPRLGYGDASIDLYVQFSAPKMVFGNNFDELVDSDLDKLCHKLWWQLALLDIGTDELQLKLADVCGIHYGKNVVLRDGSVPAFYLNEFRWADIPMSKDVAEVHYRNGGLCYKYHTNHTELALYDKLLDLKQAKISEARAVEMDNKMQLGLLPLFDEVRKKEPFEIIRLEMRMNKRQKIKRGLLMAGYFKMDLKLNNLFKQEIARKVCLVHLIDVMDKIPPLLRVNESRDDLLLADLMINNPKVSVERLLASLEARRMVNDLGMRNFRMMFKNKSEYTWSRIKDNLSLQVSASANDYLGQLWAEVSKFERNMPIAEIEDLINNDKYES